MPAFGPDKISDADLEALLAYAQTIGAVTQYKGVRPLVRQSG